MRRSGRSLGKKRRKTVAPAAFGLNFSSLLSSFSCSQQLQQEAAGAAFHAAAAKQVRKVPEVICCVLCPNIQRHLHDHGRTWTTSSSHRTMEPKSTGPIRAQHAQRGEY